MFPRTIHNLEAHACISAMQKFCRRGQEREAMEVAVELGHTSKGFASWVTNRLQIISHEDMGLAAPEVITLVRTCCEQAKEVYDQAKPGDWRLIVGTAICAICRANKSREGVHFGASIGLRSQLEDYVPTIPDWVHDQHTIKGKAKGRGIDYFREVSAILSPAPAKKDAYEDEAYRLWKLRETREAGAKGKKEKGQDSGSGTKERGVKKLF